jgi:hypothetical protein
MFTKLLSELGTLEFSGWLALHNYNEPLANPRLLQELAAIRDILPRCKPSVFTNGDRLTPTMVIALRDLGVTYVRATLYPPGRPTRHTPSADQIQSWLRKKHLEDLVSWTVSAVRQGLSATGSSGGLTIEIISPDLARYNWRGGTAPAFASATRTEPCYMTTHSASIDYRGRLKMCCNVFADNPTHEAHVIGDLASHTFQDLWQSPQLELLREAHGRADWLGASLCSRCGQSLPKEQVVNLRITIEGA